MTGFGLRLMLLVCAVGCGATESGANAPMSGLSSPAPSGPEAAAGAGEGARGESPASRRQIVYTATLGISVENLAATDRQIRQITAQLEGYVAEFRENRNYGSLRSGHWTVRVPASAFDRFCDAASELGISDHREVKAEDITEEYVDLNARLKNKQTLETRLLQIVAQQSDDLKDLLAAEAELGRVREEIERLQGRLRLLADRVRMTTVTITAYERQGYRPPEATFAGRVAHTFHQSVSHLQQAAEACVLVWVALLPWLAVVALVLVPLIAFLRWRRKKPGSPSVAAA